MAQQLREILERVRIEVAGVLCKRHGQYRLDLDPERHRRLSDQQVRTRGHADDEMQIGVGQVLLELAHETCNRLPQLRQLLRVEIAMTRHPHHERGIRDRAGLGCIHDGTGASGSQAHCTGAGIVRAAAPRPQWRRALAPGKRCSG